MSTPNKVAEIIQEIEMTKNAQRELVKMTKTSQIKTFLAIQNSKDEIAIMQTSEETTPRTIQHLEYKAPTMVQTSKGNATLIQISKTKSSSMPILGDGTLVDTASEDVAPMVQAKGRSVMRWAGGNKSSMTTKKSDNNAPSDMKTTEDVSQTNNDDVPIIQNNEIETSMVMKALVPVMVLTGGGCSPIWTGGKASIMSSAARDEGAIIRTDGDKIQCSPSTLTIDPTGSPDFGATSDKSCGLKASGLPRTKHCSPPVQFPPPQSESNTGLSSSVSELNPPVFAKLPKYKQSPPTEKLEVIVAHNDEDLHWLRPFLRHLGVKVSIYSKGGRNLAPDLHAHTIYLDNIGRESHTYLYHIVTRYDSLSEITLFCQVDHA